MKLSTVRTHANSWMIKAILWLVVAAFVGTIFYSWGMGGTDQKGAVVASVNGKIINYNEYREAYTRMAEFYRRQMKGALQENILQGLKDSVLDNLVKRELLIQKAREEGLMVSDQEVKDHIQAIPLFQAEGKFKEDIYKNFLHNNGMVPREFEEDTRSDLLVEKMSNLVKEAAWVSDPEVEYLTNKMEERTALRYLPLTGAQFQDKVQVKEEDLNAYFEKNREKFRLPEKRSADYILVSARGFMEKAGVAGDEVEDHYYQNIKDFQTPKEVRASHILIQYPGPMGGEVAPEVESQTKDRAEAVLKEVKEGGDFAALAKKYSNDTGSASKGGDLGFFPRGRMVRPFEEAAFSMKKGEISSLVNTQFGYHILKVEDIREEKTSSLEEVREQVEKTIRSKKGMRRAKQRLDELLKSSGAQGVTLESLAKEFETEVRQTPSFSRMDTKAGDLQNPSEVINAVFSITEREIGGPVETMDGYYLFRVKEIVPSSLPSLDEIKKEVRAAYVEEAADQRCEEEMENLMKEISGKPEAMDELGKRFHLPVQSPGPLNREHLAAKFQVGPEEMDSVSRKAEGEAGFIKSFATFYLYVVQKKEQPDPSTLQQAREKHRRDILEKKKNAIFTAWIEDLKKKSKIEIDKTLVD